MANPLNDKRVLYYCLFLIIIIAAFAVRIPKLTQRPMHTDESVQAAKFGMLLENNYYRYNSKEFHGPTLYYLTLIPAWLTSAVSIKEIDESTLRIVPVAAGFLLIPVLFFMVNGLSWQVIIAAGLFTAFSSGMVFFSRYYIQEMLLIFFTFAVIISGYRYLKSKHIGWALSAGFFLGLMHATKETCIITFVSMLAALIVTLFMQQKSPRLILRSIRSITVRHAAAIIITMVTVSALFYSSFFTNPASILDSYLTYLHYFDKASNYKWHIHPFYYYFKILLFPDGISGMAGSELLIVLLAMAGIFAAVFKKGISGVDFNLIRFFVFYTIFMIIIYSVIPYKTPWLTIGFLHGLLLLAAVGAVAIINIKVNKFLRVCYVLILIFCYALVIKQTCLLNYKYCADPKNPYVYAHTSNDIFGIVRRINELADVHHDGKNMYIEVVCPNNDYWPLPWYLRSFPNIGWWDKVDMNKPAAPVIIAAPGVEPDIIKKLYELPPPGKKNLYVPLFDAYTELRPQVELRGYVVKDLWDKYLQQKE